VLTGLTWLTGLTRLAAPSYAARTVTLPPTGTDRAHQHGGPRPVPGHDGWTSRAALVLGTASAAATSPTTPTTCWPWSTARRRPDLARRTRVVPTSASDRLRP